MVECGFVEDEEVGRARKDKVYEDTEEPVMALLADTCRAVLGAAHTM
jgi:hypothetical protein